MLPLGAEGELWAQVEGQMRGFWDDDELTATRLVDGWVRTRDIGRIDANGFVYVLDRADDMIVSGGFNIWPAELETAIADHPEVDRGGRVRDPARAVGRDADGGLPAWRRTPTVTADGDHRPGASSAWARTRSRAPVEFTTEPLPKNVVGKLLRKALREPHWAGQGRRWRCLSRATLTRTIHGSLTMTQTSTRPTRGGR